MSVIGVDLGGTKVAVARLDGRELGASLVQPTDRSGAAGLLAQVAAMVQSVRGDEHEAVGIGVPSVVDLETGRVVSSVNVPLGELPLRDLLADRLDAPVYVDNDATVAAFAEAHDDQLRLMADNLVMITIGTGIGGGLVLGGRIYRGRTGGAGELGHTLVGMDLAVTVAAPVGFPQPGSLERLTAGQALGRLAEQAAAADPNSAPGSFRTLGRSRRGAGRAGWGCDGGARHRAVGRASRDRRR